MIWSDVALAAVTDAATPPTRTTFSPGVAPNLDPVIVAGWPSTSVPGVTPVICGASAGLPDETVICAEPDFPSAVATIIVEPGATAVTTPAVDTDAICALSDDQEMFRPVRTLLFASRVTAVACVV